LVKRGALTRSATAMDVVWLFGPAAGLGGKQAAGPPPITTVPEAVRTRLPDTPQVFGTDPVKYRVVPIKGLVNPWALAFLPNGDILVTEKRGRLRIIRNGVLDPQPIAGMPEVSTRAISSGLMDL